MYKSWFTPIEDIDMVTSVRIFDEAEEYEAIPERKPGFFGWVSYIWNS